MREIEYNEKNCFYSIGVYNVYTLKEHLQKKRCVARSTLFRISMFTSTNNKSQLLFGSVGYYMYGGIGLMLPYHVYRLSVLRIWARTLYSRCFFQMNSRIVRMFSPRCVYFKLCSAVCLPCHFAYLYTCIQTFEL